ncbi:hypothetical protein LX32DRAFT_90753 [Colletotrichum zoysiae]|uniref:Uncharacterized protein n=1 Tax=Colletotrichum zoysiae TaxID=1216348 RepID=A0AAD9H9N9_9PEZI|nr:hypothetical protein LX32DRAFT_90753 [Colletotrichum zoysiae]
MRVPRSLPDTLCILAFNPLPASHRFDSPQPPYAVQAFSPFVSPSCSIASNTTEPAGPNCKQSAVSRQPAMDIHALGRRSAPNEVVRPSDQGRSAYQPELQTLLTTVSHEAFPVSQPNLLPQQSSIICFGYSVLALAPFAPPQPLFSHNCISCFGMRPPTVGVSVGTP